VRWGKCGFQHKCSLYLGNGEWYGECYYRPLIASHIRASIGTKFYDLEWHLKVISAHFVIPTSNRPYLGNYIRYIRRHKPKLLKRNHTTAFRWYDCLWRYFKVIRLFLVKFLINSAKYGKSYCRLLIGNHTLAFDWCHFWWRWRTVEGHFSLDCHFHVKYLRNYTRYVRSLMKLCIRNHTRAFKWYVHCQWPQGYFKVSRLFYVVSLPVDFRYFATYKLIRTT